LTPQRCFFNKTAFSHILIRRRWPRVARSARASFSCAVFPCALSKRHHHVPGPLSAWAAIRHAYEHTDRAVEDICAIHGISSGTLRDRMRRYWSGGEWRYGWGGPGFYRGRYNGGTFGPCWTNTPIGQIWNCGM
jgi:hypothetical protein